VQGKRKPTSQRNVTIHLGKGILLLKKQILIQKGFENKTTLFPAVTPESW
jgi:hypothetical protein